MTNLGREDQIFKDGFVNGLQGSASRSLLFGTRLSGWLGYHSSLSDEKDVDTRELLFQLASESVNIGVHSVCVYKVVDLS